MTAKTHASTRQSTPSSPTQTTMSVLHALVANPALVLQHRNIFLLSHMRANTSLFGHLLGSHPQVEGYYELHIGYHSWKSLWRQKLVHFSEHSAKPQARWMFDKVLHDGHAVRPEILLRRQSRTVMMLREPEQSIKSLVTLYRNDSKVHLPEASVEGAAAYYIGRLETLASLAPLLARRFLYLDAECLVQQTAPTLDRIGRWLELVGPIPTEYQTFNRTGKSNAGDTSQVLKSGKVSRRSASYDSIDLAEPWLGRARDAYARTRSTLLQHSDVQCTMLGSACIDDPANVSTAEALAR